MAAQHASPQHPHHTDTVHEHGAMDVRAHERTFDGFMRLLVWSAVGTIAVLVFLALANA